MAKRYSVMPESNEFLKDRVANNNVDESEPIFVDLGNGVGVALEYLDETDPANPKIRYAMPVISATPSIFTNADEEMAQFLHALGVSIFKWSFVEKNLAGLYGSLFAFDARSEAAAESSCFAIRDMSNRIEMIRLAARIALEKPDWETCSKLLDATEALNKQRNLIVHNDIVRSNGSDDGYYIHSESFLLDPRYMGGSYEKESGKMGRAKKNKGRFNLKQIDEAGDQFFDTATSIAGLAGRIRKLRSGT